MTIIRKFDKEDQLFVNRMNKMKVGLIIPKQDK